MKKLFNLFSSAVVLLLLLFGSVSQWHGREIAAGVTGVPWDQQPVTYTSDNLGIDFPWANLHNGSEAVNWVNSSYNAQQIERDLTDISSMGVKKIRTWCQLESLYDFTNNVFVAHSSSIANLDDFLTRASNHNLSVICVMGDGHYDGLPNNLDGKLRWNLIQSQGGIQVYTKAYINYITHFRQHQNILMWEINNEPYGSLTWSGAPQALGVTQQQVHAFLLAAYHSIKPLVGNTYVGFSDYEEEQQQKYQLYSQPSVRASLIDDCTDVYSMHIYRGLPSQIYDFRSLTGKPKWVTELGSYNYNDPNGISHPIPAQNDLFDMNKNYNAVVPIAQKLSNSGFSLIMPWSFNSNSGMVTHNPDGSNILLKLPLWMQSQLLSSVSLVPSVSPTLTATPTSSGGTQFSITVCPHGLGNCGDNVNPQSGGNSSPKHISRSITLIILNNLGQSVTQGSGSVAYNSSSQNFQGAISIPNLNSGQYLASVKIDGFLSKQIPGIITVSQRQTINLASVSLVTGDINNDNQLDILDYNILIGCFGSKQNTSSCTIPPTALLSGADINDDGIVDGADYNEFLRELSLQRGG